MAISGQVATVRLLQPAPTLQAGIEAEWIPIYGNNCAERAWQREYIEMVEAVRALG